MIINVHGGHSSYPNGAYGAVGTYLNESVEDRKVKDRVISLLRAQGHTVYDCTSDGATANAVLKNIVAKCNAHAVNLDVSIHFNSAGETAHGTEVWIKNGSKSRPYAEQIVNSIASLGFTNRGVKTRDDLYVLNKTKAPALLIECCFVNNAGDASLYNPDTMAEAIVRGITGGATVTPAPAPTPQPTPVPQKEQIGVDGYWGSSTTVFAQKKFGCSYVDGIVSRQPLANKKYCSACTTGWEFTNNYRGGSSLIKAIQRWVGVSADGLIGKGTITALQRKLGVSADGYMGRNTVMAFQRYLNNL